MIYGLIALGIFCVGSLVGIVVLWRRDRADIRELAALYKRPDE